ncbi:hypothetical protein C7S18_11765 [Ahniella affigens]|uniref:histidine kinase n=1 Tax=Ahniella affigens TaxID=2021234 RepID=A0A2P1PSN6_9GAMM|nr:two-component regulator propeller domain-containing protein [Ahniella affigens]AVP97832.1 hypothetical protein C7S18_11765 [Ahniella affigens]
MAPRSPWLAYLSIILVLFAQIAWAARPQSAASVFDDVRFRPVTVEDGLSQSTVRSMVQDLSGTVWVGTIDGLNRLDAHSIRVYRHADDQPNSLPDNHVATLVLATSGELWLGTQGRGLARYRPETDDFEQIDLDPDGSLPAANSVSALVSDGAGGIWVASAGGRLRRVDTHTRRIETLGLDFGPALTAVRDLALLDDGRLAVASGIGAFVVSADRKQIQELKLDGHALNAYTLVQGNRGAILVGTGSDGLIEFQNQTVLNHYRAKDGLVSDAVRSLKRDASGRLWVGTNGGISRIDQRHRQIDSWTQDPIGRNGLGGNRVESMMIDRDGLLWIGTWSNGISIHDPQTESFQTFKYRPDRPNFLASSTVTALTMTHDGMLIAGLHEEGGGARIDLQQGVVQRYLHDPARTDSIAASSIATLLERRDGSLWFGTQTAGLSKLRPDSRDHFELYQYDPAAPTSLSSNNVADLLEDRSGNLWVATIGGGIDRLCPGCTDFERLGSTDGLSSVYANTLLETADGGIWIGYRTVGVDRLDPVTGVVTAYRAGATPGSLSSNAVTHLYEARDGSLWVATQGGGLNRGRRDDAGRYVFHALRRAEGLGSDMVSAVGEDGSGAIWVSTATGISRINPADQSIVNFGWSEGAQRRGYFVGAIAKQSEDIFYFGGLEGITRFDARRIGEPRPPRRPQISAITALSREQATHRRIAVSRPLQAGTPTLATVDLAYDDDIVHFEFSTFNFANAESIHYAYQLEGFDEHWVNLEDGSNRATFTDLPAGEYALFVRAAGPRSLRWIDSEGPVVVRVASAPWWNPFAIAAYAVLLLCLGTWLGWTLWQAVRQRLAAQQRLQESEQRLALALEASGDEIWECDFLDHRLIRFTPHIELRIPSDTKVFSMSMLRDIVHPDDLHIFDHAMRDVLKGTKEQMRATYRMGLANGGWIWVQSYGRVVERDAQGLVRRIAGVSRDVSEIMAQDEALQRINQDLERRVESRTRDFQIANEHLRRTLDDLRNAQKQLVESEKMAALGGLVAGVAHEINTPLGIGVTAASHLETESRRIGEQARQNTLKRSDLEQFLAIADESSQLILRNLRRADHLIKSFKQVAVDQSSEQRRMVNLREYLDEILTSLQPRLKKTPFKVSIDCPGDLLVDTFPGALYQVFVNLVMNSIIHGFEGREHGQIEIHASVQRDRLCIVYRDDGRGMAVEVVARIFEPFFTTKRGQGGSGLGMHIVYNLVVQLLGGSVRCQSEPGQGVQFLIELPLASGDAAR